MPGVDGCFIGPNDLAASMGIGLGVPLESDIRAWSKRSPKSRNLPQVGVAPGIHTSGADRY